MLSSIVFSIILVLIVFIGIAVCIPFIVRYITSRKPLSVVIRELETSQLLPLLTSLYTNPNDSASHELFLERINSFFEILRRRFYGISYLSSYLMSKIVRHLKKHPSDELGFIRAYAFIEKLKETDIHDASISNSMFEISMESLNLSPTVFHLIMLSIPKLYRLNIPVLTLPEMKLIKSLLLFTRNQKMLGDYGKVIYCSTAIVICKESVSDQSPMALKVIQQNIYTLTVLYVEFVLEYFHAEQVRTDFLNWTQKYHKWFVQDHIIAILSLFNAILIRYPDNQSVHEYIYHCIQQIENLTTDNFHPIRHTFYEKVLDVLQEHPESINLRKFALDFGRWHFFMYKTPLIYDEARLQNDILIRTMKR